MNLQLQPRTNPMLSHAYLACVLRGSSHPRRVLQVCVSSTPNQLWLEELTLRNNSPHASQRLLSLRKQLTHIQRP